MRKVIEGQYKVVGESVGDLPPRSETAAEREDRKWATYEQIGMSIVSALFFLVWYVWVAKPLHAWLWKVTGAFNHWAGWS